MPPIRTAVLGYGLAGRVFHCPFLSAVPGLELAAIVQRTGDSAVQAWPRARILRSAEEAFTDPTLDLIVVATPDETHAGFAARALQAGKHVVVDKPVATSATDVRCLRDLARNANRLLCPFQNRRWDGDFLTVSEVLRSRRLGHVVEITSRFDRFRPLPKAHTWKEAGSNHGGLLLDLGSHLLDQALALFGAPDRINASVRREREATAIDDAFTINLGYDYAPLAGGPLRYICAATMIAAAPSSRFRVHGTRGSYLKYGVDPQEPTVVAGTLPPPVGKTLADGRPWLREEPHAWGMLTLAPDPAHPSHLAREDLRTEAGDYRRFYENVRDAIVLNQPLAVTADDAVRTATLLDLAQQSSRERRTLDVHF